VTTQPIPDLASWSTSKDGCAGRPGTFPGSESSSRLQVRRLMGTRRNFAPFPRRTLRKLARLPSPSAGTGDRSARETGWPRCAPESSRRPGSRACRGGSMPWFSTLRRTTDASFLKVRRGKRQRCAGSHQPPPAAELARYLKPCPAGLSANQFLALLQDGKSVSVE